MKITRLLFATLLALSAQSALATTYSYRVAVVGGGYGGPPGVQFYSDASCGASTTTLMANVFDLATACATKAKQMRDAAATAPRSYCYGYSSSLSTVSCSSGGGGYGGGTGTTTYSVCNINLTSPARTVEVRDPVGVVQSVEYYPVGRQSSVSYGTGSSEGTRFSITVNTATSASGGISLGPISFGGSYSTTQSMSYGISITKSLNVTRTLSGAAVPDDLLHKEFDNLWVWTNPRVTTYVACPGVAEQPEEQVWTTYDGLAPSILRFESKEIVNPAVSVDAMNRAFLARSTSDDRNALLFTDINYYPPGPFDPKRIQKVGSAQLRGPDYAGGSSNATTFNISYNTVRDLTYGSGVSAGGSIMLKLGPLSLGGGKSISYQETRTQSAGEQQTASVTLKTDTICVITDVDVYIDAIFGTYLTVPTATRACTAPAFAAGSAAPNSTVQVQTKDGLRWVPVDGAGRWIAY